MIPTGRGRLAPREATSILVGMRNRRRILEILLALGLLLGLPGQAAQMISMGSMDVAMAAGDMSPADCEHCDMEKMIDMTSCSGPCFVMPALEPGNAAKTVSMLSVLLQAPSFGAVQGRAPPPESGAPKASPLI